MPCHITKHAEGFLQRSSFVIKNYTRWWSFEDSQQEKPLPDVGVEMANIVVGVVFLFF